MSDSDDSKKKPGMPSWQQKPEDQTTTKDPEPAPETSTPRESTIEQAKKFLEEEEVRNASTEKKIAFLESKGIQGDDIQKLLGGSPNTGHSSATPPIARSSEQTSQTTQLQARSPPSSSSTQQQQQEYSPRPPQPPIITYPEFLTKPTSPSPLITKPRLLTTLYLFSGLSLLLYGTHTYLTTPMLASLTSSRHSLAETAAKNLGKLIERLEGIVSEVPGAVLAAGQKRIAGQDGEGRYRDDSSDEDPTELFHRDIGIQTSLPSTPAPASPSLSASQLHGASASSYATESQATRLASLKSSIESVVEDSTSEGYDQQELEAAIGVLREYCDGLAYVTPTVYGYGGAVSGGGRDNEKDDEIARVKAGIRGVKGVLLSARSFPGGVRADVR